DLGECGAGQRKARPWWLRVGQAQAGRAGGRVDRCAGLLLALWSPTALAQVSVAVSDASVVEGNTGTRSMVFTVTRTGDPTAARFLYTTATGGTATAVTDYTAMSGSVALAAGQATATFSVPVRGDTLVEPQETVLVSITNDPVNAQPLVVLDGAGIGTIIDDDTVPTASISVSPASVVENGTPTWSTGSH
ncbi:Calx-beta domain-containing protein, partial [Pseudoxanthomonas daejeonensis]|uniref:Calx-beta domain-containing protein n=1 Tax=Pseudoxanthomonas daejeonensis TaxID=266062 RepID=UPI002368DB7D